LKEGKALKEPRTFRAEKNSSAETAARISKRGREEKVKGFLLAGRGGGEKDNLHSVFSRSSNRDEEKDGVARLERAESGEVTSRGES